MNTEHDPEMAEAARSRLHPALAAAMNAERTPTPEPGGPEQVEAERSMLSVHRDPSLTRRAERDSMEADSVEPEPDAETKRRTQIRWVRPTELAMQGGARATGWGLDLRAELAQRLRDTRADRAQHRAPERGDQASRLPDLSIRGRRRQARPEPARSGMGLR